MSVHKNISLGRYCLRVPYIRKNRKCVLIPIAFLGEFDNKNN